MAHLAKFLPEELEIGAKAQRMPGTEVVDTDGGFEHRNQRWSRRKRAYEISFPISLRDGAVYQAVCDLYEEAEDFTHTFNFTDWTDESGSTVVKVRFNSPLEIVGIAPHLDHIETISLIEVF